MINLITPEEKDAMRLYIYNYGTYEKEPDMDAFLQNWSENKQYLFNLFGNQLILKKEIDYTKNIKEYNSELNHLMFDSDFMYNLKSAMNYDFTLSHLLFNEYFYNNKYEGGTLTFNTPNGKLVIPTGSKISKALGKLAKAYGVEGYEEFRQAHSMILNHRTLKGTLCLSIHPFDYITMSDNACNWESCMNWSADDEGGDYRMGTLEMLNSPCVAVAYLCSDKPYHPNYCEDFTWSNKKWRSLIIITPEVIHSICGYPYEDYELDKEILELVRNLMPNKEDFGSILHLKNRDCFDDKCSISFYTNRMYNDTNSHKGSTIVSNKVKSSINIRYSGPAYCLVCGEEFYSIMEAANRVACSSCHEIEPEYEYFCYHCDCGLYEEDVIWIDGYCYCEACIDRLGGYYYSGYDNGYHFKNDAIIYEMHDEEDEVELLYIDQDNEEQFAADVGIEVDDRDIYLNNLSEDTKATLKSILFRTEFY